MGYWRRELRAYRRQMTPRRVLMRVLFGNRDQPTFAKLRKMAFGSKTVASISRDPRTGKVRARGVKRTKDGWALTPGTKPLSPRAKRKRESAAEQRRIERTAARMSRRSTRAGRAKAALGNGELARDFRQGAGGRMNGSGSAKTGLSTPRQATGLTRLRCDWCRSTGVRPIFTGSGQIKTVIAVQSCNHRWSSKGNGPAQKPAGRHDKLLCPPCENSGEITLTTTRHADGAKTVSTLPCFTCLGWIRHW